jgi:DNA-binding transcriptional LysR family regulator
MPRHISLRQIEAFQAVMLNGTVSGAAQLLNMTQPAMSKIIAHLEFDTGLKLFDRVKGRLAPTPHAMRLHEEVGRIFAGVRQVENVVDSIRREDQGRLSIGVMFALAGSFIQQATTSFLAEHPNVFCSYESRSSQWLLDLLIAKKLDIALVGIGFNNPYVSIEPLMEHPLVCIMPRGHPLAEKSLIEPHDLQGVPFTSFYPDSYPGHQVEQMFDKYGVAANIVSFANMALTVCEAVAAGVAVSLVHPLMVTGYESRIAVRRFEPSISYKFQLCRHSESRNARLVEGFAHALRSTAEEISRSMLAL